MLSVEDNEKLTRVGPGTPMGDMMRQYWLPAARSDELPAADGAPLRLRILGENLVAFRVTSGRIGLMRNGCPHRGASLFFGRNEEDGLRCVYHGWKFDVTGRCVDMPSEPEATGFKEKVRATAYPCLERGGIIWAYLGQREVPPPLPDLEANMADGTVVSTVQRECNWLQALEGDIDTVHFMFLHYGHLKLEDTFDDSFFHYQVQSPAAKFNVHHTDFGTCYGAFRPAGPDTYYWRVANFLFPFYTQVPPGVLAVKRQFRAWVPMDDEHTMFFVVTAPPAGKVENDPERQKRTFTRVQEILPDEAGWYGRSRAKANARNDYLVDREMQMNGESYTGLPSVFLEDQAVTESMGPVYDRSSEHLGTSDTMVIQTRLAILKVVEDWSERGVVPPGVDNPEVYAQRSGGLILERSEDWYESTRELRKAFVQHSQAEIDASLGRRPVEVTPGISA